MSLWLRLTTLFILSACTRQHEPSPEPPSLETSSHVELNLRFVGSWNPSDDCEFPESYAHPIEIKKHKETGIFSLHGASQNPYPLNKNSTVKSIAQDGTPFEIYRQVEKIEKGIAIATGIVEHQNERPDVTATLDTFLLENDDTLVRYRSPSAQTPASENKRSETCEYSRHIGSI